MNITLSPGALTGTTAAPPSKSVSHRAVICASLAGGVSQIHNIDLSDDILATVNGLRALGAKITEFGDSLLVDGGEIFRRSHAEIDCGESGSTLRFLVPLAAAGGVNSRFCGRGRLPERPLSVFANLLPKHGVACRTEGGLPLEIAGNLTPGRFFVPGNVSSQFISGLLMALPLLDVGSEIFLTTHLESKPYVDLTAEVMSAYGIRLEEFKSGYKIRGGQAYNVRRFTVEGDWSNAAFFIAAGVLGGSISLTGLNSRSLQGDRAAFAVFREFGGEISFQSGVLTAKGGELRALDVNVSQIPDLVPVIAAAAAFAAGETVIRGAARLRDKESDRLACCAENLRRAGIEVSEDADCLRIVGGKPKGAVFSGFGDHRIVMAFAVLAAYAEGDSVIEGAEAVRKSFPGFFERIKELGANAVEK
ncbi:MAG: 3-phosphoshikimate 1-carboxyvinyltransferase [Oscillospiraceae bacterium]|jgi:3-phosphoshikimate 1-carboxyvinyltransferase|nr:3-phosphoshikimate 1-carboxyvinyltransferase [Oscillospiraceae bacterium]